MLCNKQVLFNSASLKAIKAKCCRNLNIVRNEYKITLIYILIYHCLAHISYIPFMIYMLVRYTLYDLYACSIWKIQYSNAFHLEQTISSRNIWSLLKLWWRSKTPPNNKFTTNDGVFRCVVSRFNPDTPQEYMKESSPIHIRSPSMRRFPCRKIDLHVKSAKNLCDSLFIWGLTGVFSQEFCGLLSF